jgi:hypothetical protein
MLRSNASARRPETASSNCSRLKTRSGARTKAASKANSERQRGTSLPERSLNVRLARSSVKFSNRQRSGAALPTGSTPPRVPCEAPEPGTDLRLPIASQIQFRPPDKLKSSIRPANLHPRYSHDITKLRAPSKLLLRNDFWLPGGDHGKVCDVCPGMRKRLRHARPYCQSQSRTTSLKWGPQCHTVRQRPHLVGSAQNTPSSRLSVP